MKIIIAGTRTITDGKIVAQAIIDSGWQDKITEVVSGGARGVDTQGELWATDRGLRWRRFDPDYRRYGPKIAPVMRNEQMAIYADALILVWTGDPQESPGSADMLRRAKVHYSPERIYKHVVKQED